MTADELLQMAIEMRRWQRLYFKTRTQVDLMKAKDAEQRFDSAVEAMRRPKLPMSETP